MHDKFPNMQALHHYLQLKAKWEAQCSRKFILHNVIRFGLFCPYKTLLELLEFLGDSVILSEDNRDGQSRCIQYHRDHVSSEVRRFLSWHTCAPSLPASFDYLLRVSTAPVRTCVSSYEWIAPTSGLPVKNGAMGAKLSICIVDEPL